MKNMKRDYSMAIEKRDFAKIDKLYDIIEDEKLLKLTTGIKLEN